MPKQKYSTFFFIFSTSILLLFFLLIQLDPTLAVQSAQPIDAPYTTLQNPSHEPKDFGGGSAEAPTDHLPDEQHAAIEAELNRNIEVLGLVDVFDVAETTAVTLSFPLKGADHFNDFGFHSVTNFVDQDSSSGEANIRDYNCGSNTYDGHYGTDYYLWPFAWNKMDNEDVEVIAAAAGTIIQKEDGHYDRSCTWDNPEVWNAVYIRHADGSVAWYGHLKKGSILTKNIGDSVAAGEYLGLVGSSGMSDGPHLHFELWQSSAYTQLRDPYAGSCNALNANSWWTEQRPYYDSAVNKITTGNAAVEFQSCSLHDITNEQTEFAPGDTIYFTTYYRDQLNTQTSQYTIRRPDNSIFQQWTHNSSDSHYNISYWYWSYTIPDGEPGGTWKFTVNYEGKLYEQPFQITYPVFIAVTNPVGGEEWLPGETHTITWQSTYNNNVNIDLYKGGILSTTLITDTPDSGEFAWTIPLSPTLAPDYQIRVSNVLTPSIFGNSGHFAIGIMEKVYLPVTLKE